MISSKCILLADYFNVNCYNNKTDIWILKLIQNKIKWVYTFLKGNKFRFKNGISECLVEQRNFVMPVVKSEHID